METMTRAARADPRRRCAGDGAGGRAAQGSSRRDGGSVRTESRRARPMAGAAVRRHSSWSRCCCCSPAPCWRSRARRAAPSSSSPVVDAVASRAPVLPAAIGIRLGFTRARGERGSLRAALAGVLFTVGGLVGAITFGASLDRLIDEPFRYGSNMDASIGDNGGEQMDDRLAATLESDPNVESLIFYAQAYAKAGDTDVPLMGMQRVRGDSAPVLLSGRLPVSEDEIAIGRVTGAACRRRRRRRGDADRVDRQPHVPRRRSRRCSPGSDRTKASARAHSPRSTAFARSATRR